MTTHECSQAMVKVPFKVSIDRILFPIVRPEGAQSGLCSLCVCASSDLRRYNTLLVHLQ